MSFQEDVGPAIRILRKRAGKTQKEVAEAAGTSKNLLSNWETGTTLPSVSSLEKTLAVFDADLLELHNTIRLRQGLPAEHPTPATVDLTRLPQPGDARLVQLLARAPEFVLWVLQLLHAFQGSEGKKP